MTKNQINFEVIKIIQLWTFWTFLLKPPQPLMGLFFHSLGTPSNVYPFILINFSSPLFNHVSLIIMISGCFKSEINMSNSSSLDLIPQVLICTTRRSFCEAFRSPIHS